ncbi:unnamed protein product [Lasius platythorax]|uniref:Uncharacterized protein n=1 Tax=Lasius platythorax TaxID=488582 RepID=A0AAV2P072_9HYME
MQFHIFLLLFFVGSVFGSQRIPRNDADTMLIHSEEIKSTLNNLQRKSLFEEESSNTKQLENISADTSNMEDNNTGLSNKDSFKFGISKILQILETICHSELLHSFFHLFDQICNICGEILFFIEKIICG